MIFAVGKSELITQQFAIQVISYLDTFQISNLFPLKYTCIFLFLCVEAWCTVGYKSPCFLVFIEINVDSASS